MSETNDITPADPAPADSIDLGQFDGHTPGPWEAGRPDMATIVDDVPSKWVYGPKRPGGNGYIAVASGQACDDWSEIMANARLIAASPTLLAEVHRLRRRVAELETWKGGG